MVAIQMRYVTKRVKAKGREIWYWQRKGFALKRLSDDPVKRFNEQARLNAQADAQKIAGDGPPYGTFSWIVKEYQASERFTKRSVSTRRVYGVWLRKLTLIWDIMPFADIDKASINELAESLVEMPASRELALAVLNNLFKFAIYRGLVQINLTRDLGLEIEASPRRDQVWSQEQIDALLHAAASHIEGDALALGVKIMLYTAQRPGDCLAMTWARWSPEGIDLRQQKTGLLMRVWCHADLAEALRRAKEKAKGLRIVTNRTGRPVDLKRFRMWFDEACTMADIKGMQLRDLRRTAVVRLAEAGCTVPQIAAVTGHAIETTQSILETYLPRTPAMAKAAILQLERGGNAKV